MYCARLEEAARVTAPPLVMPVAMLKTIPVIPIAVTSLAR